MGNIEEILARLDKQTLSKFKRGAEISNKSLPTASFGLNLLTGGLGIGKQTTFYGSFSTGKSAIMLETIGINQRNGVGCGYIDAEKTFDPDWAERLGVDTEELFVSQASSISDATDIAHDWIKAGVELVVVDSTSALMPDSFYDKEGELKDFDGTKQQGQQARDLGKMSAMVAAINYDAAFVHLSQARMDLGGFIPTTKASGGKQIEHSDSLKIYLTASNADSQAIKGEVQRGERLVQERIGRTVKWKVIKNKVNGRYNAGEYNLYTAGEVVGIDRAAEIAELGIEFGIIEGAGARFSYGEEKFHGKKNLHNFIRENEAARIDLEERIIKAYV